MTAVQMCIRDRVSVGPEIAEGFEDFHKGIADAAPFARPEHPNSKDVYKRQP